nr:MAG: hypothetical protein 2 [Marnaviridae sp.]
MGPFTAMEYQADVAMGTSEQHDISEESTATLSFLEKAAGYSVGKPAVLPPESYSDATPNVGLAEFLSRPVKINTFTWNESDTVGTSVTINPWQLFFTDNNIRNKLFSYAWLKCDLKIKVMINASPFYYGANLCSYQPLPSFHDGGVVTDTATRYFIPLSQRPHIWIYPQNNEGGEMVLPFMWPKNWISTLKNQDFLDMGALNFRVVSPLTSANGVTTSGVTITTYAWAENVVLSGPTYGLLLQSDEYSKTPVSSMASAVAASMKALSKVPLIGKYATATQIGAEAIAQVASNLGFSNPPVISDVHPLKPVNVPPLASAEISYPIEKLSIDPKNELSVDPTLVGLSGEDELSIQHLISRESYITQFPWSTTNAADDLLFNTAIVPGMYDIDASGKMYMSPMAWVSQAFQYWRGDIIIRLRFICSQYHRGRVRIIYDPSASSAQNILNNIPTQTAVFNEVIDLTKDTNVEIRVPYNQDIAWLQTFNPFSAAQVPFTVGNSTTFNHVPGTSNGILAIRCVTALSAPVASSSINCIVSVRGADNLEFAAPSEFPARYSYFIQQSEEYEETESHQIVAGHAPSVAAPGRYLVNHGESIVSLRQLLRRFCYSRTSSSDSSGTAANMRVWSESFNRFPMYNGYDPTGINTAVSLLAGANAPYNFCQMTYLNWFTPAFLGYRGSINYVINIDNFSTAIKAAQVSRTEVKLSGYGSNLFSQTWANNTPSNNTRYWSNIVQPFTNGGGALTNQLTNGSLCFQTPMYSAYKFNTTTPRNSTSTISQDDTSYQMLKFTATANATNAGPNFFHWFVGAGTDFTTHFFLNVPTIYVYSSVPAAAATG